MPKNRKTIPLTASDIQIRQAYQQNAKHVQLGDLHERMKWLVGCKEALREHVEGLQDQKLIALVQELGVAVLDLESEVAYYPPADPPFVRRDNGGVFHGISQHEKNP